MSEQPAHATPAPTLFDVDGSASLPIPLTRVFPTPSPRQIFHSSKQTGITMRVLHLFGPLILRLSAPHGARMPRPLAPGSIASARPTSSPLFPTYPWFLPVAAVTIRRPTSTDANGRVRRAQTYQINRWNILAEWMSSAAAVSLISFYSFALLTTPTDQRISTTYKLLAANVIMSCYMRLCYILHTSSKSYVLIKEGETETASLPFMHVIESVSSAMFLVEPGHFVCLCWITHISFPFKPCDGLPYWAACRSLHVTSTIFVAAWILTGLAFAFITMCFTMFERSRSNEVHRTLRNMAPIPSQVSRL